MSLSLVGEPIKMASGWAVSLFPDWVWRCGPGLSWWYRRGAVTRLRRRGRRIPLGPSW